MNIEIGHADASEAPFVLATWGESFSKCFTNRQMPRKAFFAWHRPRMLKLLQRADVFVARDDEDQRYIAGWMVAERIDGRMVVHYAYVRPSLQRNGIAAALLRHASRQLARSTDHDAAYTHRTVRFASTYLDARGFIYNPRLIDGISNNQQASLSGARNRPT